MSTPLKACAAAAAMLLALTACGSDNDGGTASGGTFDSALAFDSAKYTTINVTIDGVKVPVRWYKEVCYVAKPTAVAATQTTLMGTTTTIANTACGYQSMNIFVPESAAANGDTALYFAVNNGGWYASYVKASVTDGASYDSTASNVAAALKAGYVYIDVATRSRGLAAADGSWPGKAPAPVVDAKAAIRYLRLNDARMPGSASRIVVNGTSGGGALSSIIGASGNSPDYLPYLAAAGAAGIDANGRSTLRDDVLAINAYCPITDLGNADLHYEWLYTAFGTRAAVGRNPNPAGSAQLAAKFPAYQQSLKLSNGSGAALTADNMMDQIRQEVIHSAEVYMAAGGTIPDLGEEMSYASGPTTKTYVNDWLDVDNGTKKVVSIDMAKYLKFVATQATLKAAPAFDQTGMTVTGATGESNLFGTSSQKYSNFTEYGWDNNDARGDGIGYDDTGITGNRYFSLATTPVMEQVKLINPLAYIATSATAAPYWYVRHGTRDRDTAFTVSINLTRALQADPDVQEVNYRLAWNQPHAGNYDVPEAMAWIAQTLKAAAARGL
ncbi:subtype B tannase [Massilia sp. METH4]|uniref:subtype B tannase n=1 Tax=Massilia sp. METH4 TaxID=3123041 RepID=UPI0030D5C082